MILIVIPYYSIIVKLVYHMCELHKCHYNYYYYYHYYYYCLHYEHEYDYCYYHHYYYYHYSAAGLPSGPWTELAPRRAPWPFSPGAQASRPEPQRRRPSNCGRGICIYICMYVCIYIYREREREVYMCAYIGGSDATVRRSATLPRLQPPSRLRLCDMPVSLCTLARTKDTTAS